MGNGCESISYEGVGCCGRFVFYLRVKSCSACTCAQPLTDNNNNTKKKKKKKEKNNSCSNVVERNRGSKIDAWWRRRERSYTLRRPCKGGAR